MLLLTLLANWGLPGGSVGKESACNARDPDSIPVSGRSPGGESGNPPQYFSGNPRQRTVLSFSPWQSQRVRHD